MDILRAYQCLPLCLPSLFSLNRQDLFEIGIDLGFLNNRINFNFTYYNIYSYNQILPVSIATSSGADALTINTGALRNRGIEFIINASIVREKNFSWDIAINGAHNSNKVVSIAAGVNQLTLGSWFGGDGVNMNVKVGDNYGSIYGYDYLYQNGQKVVNLIYGDGTNTGNGPCSWRTVCHFCGFCKNRQCHAKNYRRDREHIQL